jgi:AcrR family transcriptional regulator
MAQSASARAEQTVRLLWRHREAQPRRRGPRPGRALDDLVAAGIEIADAEGLSGLSVRRLAERIEVSRMSVYSYVCDLDQLTDLMIDQVNGELISGDHVGGADGPRRFPYGPRSRPPADRLTGWRRAARTVADANLDLARRHPWLTERTNDKPVLGPYTTAKYDAELAVFDELGLTDPQMDLALWQLLNHVRGIAADLRASAADPESVAAWWQGSAAAVAERIGAEEFPLAVRVGASVGQAQQSAYDPLTSYRFGLARVLDGLQTLIERG